MTVIEESLANETLQMLTAQLDQQRAAYLADPVPSYEQRREDLLALKRMINENRESIIDAICKDYGNRSRHETLFAEVISVTDGINDTIKHLKKWMKVQKRHVDLGMFPGGKNLSLIHI
mgnify:CR=1 FL=1